MNSNTSPESPLLHIYSFINLSLVTALSWSGFGGPKTYPGNTGHEVGIHAEWETSLSQDTTHTHIQKSHYDIYVSFKW